MSEHLDIIVSDALIRAHASDQSFRRGQEYFRSKAVHSLIRRGSALEAEVEGSEPRPYRVRVAFAAGSLTASCDCPYDWGDWCKHIVAMLLAYLDGDRLEERPPLVSRLASLAPEQMREALLRVSARDSAFATAIEQELDFIGLDSREASSLIQRTLRDRASQPAAVRKALRQRVRSLSRMRPSEAYWHVGEVVQELRENDLALAWGCLDDDDGPGALTILQALTEAYMDEWEALDDSDGEASAFFDDLGEAWCEALLSADLTVDEGKAWARQMRRWADDLEHDYGVGDGFYTAEAAAVKAWQRRELAAAHRSHDGESPLVELSSHGEPTALTQARLNVFARQKRYDDYLRLAFEAGEFDAYATMLVQLGRLEEAVDFGLQNIEEATGALRLAMALDRNGATEAALRVAEHGLILAGPLADLATVVLDLSVRLQQVNTGIRAAFILARERPTLSTYLAAQALAGPVWERVRPEFMARLKEAGPLGPSGAVEILLHEGLIDEAIEAVRDIWDYRLLARVADAAVESRPQWVIDASRNQAESILNQAKADAYGVAIRWLERARAAYRAGDRELEWCGYLAELTARHARKHKLRPMLEGLRRAGSR